MRSLARLLIFAALPLAATAQDTTVREGDHFRVIAHFAHQRSAEQALLAAEAAWQAVSRLFEPRDGELFEVHLYRTEAAYRESDQQLTGGQFQRNQAFAHFETRTAHVAVQPELSDEALDVIGPGAQTLRLVAHEAAHLVRFHSFRNYRSHPDWMADGLATWAESVALAELGFFNGVEEYPVFSTYLYRLQNLHKSGRLPEVEDLLVGGTGDLEFSEVYAVHWLLFQLVVDDHFDRLRQWFVELRRLGGGGNFAERAGNRFRSTVAGGKLAPLDRAMRDTVTRLEPVWIQQLRTLETGGEDWEQAAFDNNAICWRLKRSGTAWTLRGSVRILPGAAQQMNVLLGKHSDGFVSVALVAGYGVTVFDWRREGNTWNRAASVRCEIPLDEFQNFELRGTTTAEVSELEVRIGGERIAKVKLPVRIDGPWGLGAQAQSAGIWRQVEFESSSR